MRRNPVLGGWRAGLPPLSWTQYPDAGGLEAAWSSSPDLVSSESAEFQILKWPAKTRHGDPRHGNLFEVVKRGAYGKRPLARTATLAAAKDVARYNQSPEASTYVQLPMDREWAGKPKRKKPRRNPVVRLAAGAREIVTRLAGLMHGRGHLVLNDAVHAAGGVTYAVDGMDEAERARAAIQRHFPYRTTVEQHPGGAACVHVFPPAVTTNPLRRKHA